MSRYRFSYDTYFRDSSGYSVVTVDHSPITVIASSQVEATEEVFKVFKGVEYKHGWTLRASLKNVEAIEQPQEAGEAAAEMAS